LTPAAFANALILTGPTASGKSAVGLVLAERLQAEIVSMDSMALYRGMDIGTAKPSTEDRQRVPHHLIDVLEPWESASLAWWLREAAKCVADIEGRGKRALIVGGTPLYLKGILHGIFEGPPGDPELRRRLEAESGTVLHARLAQVDAVTAGKLHPNDQRRLVRALEVHELTGKPMSYWQQEFSRLLPRRLSPVWLDLSRQTLYDRIDQRVEAMFAAGLVDEVRTLTRLPRPLSREARQALGYKEVLAQFAGEQDLTATVAEVQLRSRNFAKRQLTWLRNLAGCERLEITDSESAAELAERVMMKWTEPDAQAKAIDPC
jgi:tRNA dimethylallyltransferase